MNITNILRMPRVTVALLSLMLALADSSQAATAPEVPVLQLHPAEPVLAPAREQMLAATMAEKRIVAVGHHGVVLLSDDDGKTFRQARSVPVNSTLTSVSFADATTGWAVGHWGVILKTTDAGETWSIQRSDITVDQPLFSVLFSSKTEGWAVGLWSLMLHTDDGGKTWTAIKPDLGGEKDRIQRNFYSIFSDGQGELFVTSEQGIVLRSEDQGKHWKKVSTGYSGSLWTGTVLSNGGIIVGGLRGSLYRSSDRGETWQSIPIAYKSSVTDLIENRNGSITGVALDGVQLVSHDGGATFTTTQSPDRAGYFAVVHALDGKPIIFSSNGILKPSR